MRIVIRRSQQLVQRDFLVHRATAVAQQGVDVVASKQVVAAAERVRHEDVHKCFSEVLSATIRLQLNYLLLSIFRVAHFESEIQFCPTSVRIDCFLGSF